MILKHLIHSIHQNLLLQIRLSDLAETNSTMIHIVHKDSILSSGLNHLRILNSSQLGGSLLISREDRHEQLSRHHLIRVINMRTALSSIVNTRSLALISENLTRERIVRTIEDIIETQIHNMILSHSSTVEDIISSANSGGNAIVVPTIVTRDEQSPLVSSGHTQKSNQEKEVLHRLQD